ncbi:MAG: GNAT family N-acetyltransferase [Chloroflexota bacterium]
MCYHVHLVQDEAGLRQLEQAWTELLLNTPVSTIFASFQWNATWWRYFGAGKTLRTLVVKDDSGRTTAIAPLMVRRQGPVRKLEFIGTGLSDYGDFLVDPASAQGSLEAIFTYLKRHHGGWDIADWDEIPPDSPLLSYLGTNRMAGLHAALIPQTPCAVISLPATWEEYVSGLPRKRRYYLGSFPRKFLSENNGELHVTTAEQDAAEAVATFYGLHMARWADKDDSLSSEHNDPAFVPFLQEACTRLAGLGWLEIVSLSANGQTVASSINFLLGNRWNSYMKGFDPEWSKARPGTVLDALRVKQAVALRATEFDFGRGDEPYKSGFGGTVRRNTRVLVARRSPASVAAFTLLMLRTRYRDFKNSSQPADSPAEKNVSEEEGSTAAAQPEL